MNKERIADMIHGKNGLPYLRVTKRNNWTRYLDRNDKSIVFKAEEKEEFMSWIKTTRLNRDYLDKTISSFNSYQQT